VSGTVFPKSSVALQDLAKVIRSKNAGPYEITFDVMFTDPAVYAHVRDSDVLTRAAIAKLYRIDDADITYCSFFEPALAFKFTLIRQDAQGKQGSVGERDTFGAQQHAPLLDIQIPPPRRIMTTRSVPTRAADADWFRQVLGQYPTGVSVVTGIDADGAPAGLAVGSFTSVSLDPPLVAFLPATSSSSWPKIAPGQKFCVNILGADQESVCGAFASKAADKFAGLSWRPAASGAPILDGAVAWVDCELEAVHEAGDHLIVVGRVVDLDIERPALPLLFFQGGYGSFSPHSLALRDTRFGVQLQLVDRARPLMEALAQRTGAQVGAAYCDGSELTMLASAGTPTDPHASAVAIGQRLPVLAPIGVWWMAHATDTQVQQWLQGIEAAELRARYRDALTQIRRTGYCLGLTSVHTEVQALVNSRSGPGGEPTAEERQLIAGLALNPMDYVPSGGDARRPGPDVVSLWAPTFSPDGEVALGLMITGYPRESRAAQAYAEDLLALTAEVTSLAAS